jgi:hypothetical protein
MINKEETIMTNQDGGADQLQMTLNINIFN